MSSTVLVIVGISGDLSRRKLLPALDKIIESSVLGSNFKILGITRRDITLGDLFDPNELPHLARRIDMFQMDVTKLSEYKRLKSYLKKMTGVAAADNQLLFYLSIPPQVSGPIIELLGSSGMVYDTTKLLLEKPFGTDLVSAQELIKQSKKHFKEDQIYRIDHYMAKEMAQNMISFRQGNSLIKRTWNKDFIESIEITANEKIDIEARAIFYEQTGALKDLVQSHLMQLVALTIMHPSEADYLVDMPKRRLEALKLIRLKCDEHGRQVARRGQYKGYRLEVKNKKSIVETYVELELMSEDPQWEGVPIKVVTGKALPKKQTRIRITYKKDQKYEANMLDININPHEDFEFHVWTKKPGYDWETEPSVLKHSFKETYDVLPDAYEQVIVDAVRSNRMLFTSSAEVLESWRILESIRQDWERSGDDLVIYNKGTEPNF